MSAAVFEYLATSSMARVRPTMPGPAAAVFLGMHNPSRPASREQRKEVVRVRPGLVDLAGPGLDLLPRQPPDRIP